MSMIGSDRDQNMLTIIEDGTIILINRAHSMIIPQLNIDSLPKLSIDLLYSPIKQLLLFLILLKLHTVFTPSIPSHVGTVIRRKNLVLEMVVVRIICLTCLLVYR